MWKINEVLINEISVPSKVTLEKPHLFKPSMVELPIVISVSPLIFLDTFDRNINNEVDEINIIFITDLKDMTISHYMAQPKSMLCRELRRNFILENFGDFDYNWLPICSKMMFSDVLSIMAEKMVAVIFRDTSVENSPVFYWYSSENYCRYFSG